MRHETLEPKAKNFKEIEEIISRAIKKVGAKRENDICRYIPMSSGGYMHHFTLKKMKTKQPKELGSMIEKFIINTDRPGRVAPKQRAPRGSRMRRGQQMFTRSQLEKMLAMATAAGDKEMVNLLAPRRSLAICKRELISSIRHGHVNVDLWNAYAEAISAQQTIQNSELFQQSDK